MKTERVAMRILVLVLGLAGLAQAEDPKKEDAIAVPAAGLPLTRASNDAPGATAAKPVASKPAPKKAPQTALKHQARWAKITGSVESVDVASNRLQLKDKFGKVVDFTATAQTEVSRNKKHGVFSEMRPGDKVTMLRYDSATKEIKLIELVSK